jgi:hypothetical protein
MLRDCFFFSVSTVGLKRRARGSSAGSSAGVGSRARVETGVETGVETTRTGVEETTGTGVETTGAEVLEAVGGSLAVVLAVVSAVPVGGSILIPKKEQIIVGYS